MEKNKAWFLALPKNGWDLARLFDHYRHSSDVMSAFLALFSVQLGNVEFYHVGFQFDISKVFYFIDFLMNIYSDEKDKLRIFSAAKVPFLHFSIAFMQTYFSDPAGRHLKYGHSFFTVFRQLPESTMKAVFEEFSEHLSTYNLHIFLRIVSDAQDCSLPFAKHVLSALLRNSLGSSIAASLQPRFDTELSILDDGIVLLERSKSVFESHYEAFSVIDKVLGHLIKPFLGVAPSNWKIIISAASALADTGSAMFTICRYAKAHPNSRIARTLALSFQVPELSQADLKKAVHVLAFDLSSFKHSVVLGDTRYFRGVSKDSVTDFRLTLASIDEADLPALVQLQGLEALPTRAAQSDMHILASRMLSAS